MFLRNKIHSITLWTLMPQNGCGKPMLQKYSTQKIQVKLIGLSSRRSKQLPCSCCLTASAVSHGGPGTCIRFCLCSASCHHVLLCQQWDNFCGEVVFILLGYHTTLLGIWFLGNMACLEKHQTLSVYVCGYQGAVWISMR